MKDPKNGVTDDHAAIQLGPAADTSSTDRIKWITFAGGADHLSGAAPM